MTGNAESDHQAAHQAKEFIISKVLQEAALEGVPLSEIEKKMLYFSEQQHEPDDLFEVNKEFDEKYDTQEYEAKISGLIRRAYQSDRESSDRLTLQWLEEIRALEKEDHYILVMVGQARLRLPGDAMRLVATIAAFAAIVAVAIYIPVKFDLSASESRTLLWIAIFAMVAVSIAMSSKWRAIIRQVASALVRGILPGSARKS